MSIKFGTKSISDIILGNKTVNSIWLGNNKVYDGSPVVEPDYLTLTALATNTIKIYAPWGSAPSVSLQYRTITGGTKSAWQSYTIGTNISLATGNSVQFYGTTTTFNTSNKVLIFSSTANFNASGNVMSLVNFGTTAGSYMFYGLFYGCPMITPPKVPATTLSDNCYNIMFQDCEQLTSVPALPATVLASNCYYGMFSGCNSLQAYKNSGSGHTCAWTIPTSGTASGSYKTQSKFLQYTIGDYSSTGSITCPVTIYTQNNPIA